MKDKLKLIFWSVFSIAVGIFLIPASVFLYHNANMSTLANLTSFIHINNTAAVAEPIFDNTTPPGEEEQKYFYVNKDTTGEPKVNALAYIVGDLNTGEVILSKNQEEKMPIASLSKLMTALVATEISKPDETAQVSKRALDTEGKNGGLSVGEKIKTADLVYPLLLESSNDAAEVLAEHFGRDSFIQKMNQEADALKMDNTSYEDPSGLSGNNQSTVADLFKLTGYLDKEKQNLIQITGKQSYSNKKHSWYNISQFLRDDGYFGGKSGYTDRALQTVVSLFSLPLGKESTRPIAIVLLKSPDRKKDVENILKYLSANVYYGGTADANTDWVKQKVGVPDIREPDFVDLTFVGDIMLDRGVRNSVARNFAGDYSKLFEKADLSKILKESDIVFGNLEGTASDKGTDRHNLYSFHMDPNVVPALAGAGINILSVANNHVGDWGRDSYADSLSRLKENEILYAGGGNNETEAETPAIIEKYGMKIGFLAFSDKGPDWMAATADQPGLLLASNPRFDDIIKAASTQVDYLVVSFHFGEEYQTTHNARQAELAHKAVDDGAKLVIGSHPHVVEDYEVYKNSYIAYSLGNFIFDQSWSQPTMQGGVLEVKLHKDGNLEVAKDTVKLNSAFQPDQIIKGKEEKVKFNQ